MRANERERERKHHELKDRISKKPSFLNMC